MSNRLRSAFKRLRQPGGPIGLALVGLAAASGLSISVAAAAQRPLVIELFTSQGCSSCPPADALLYELSQRPDIVALGFHVDYWDNLGWKDPLSAPGSTQRQRDYAQLLNLPNIYTPQMVIDGHLQLVGSDRTGIAAAIDRTTRQTATEISFAPDQHSVIIGAGNGAGKVLMVRFRRHLETSVANGENAGTEARDANGVTSLTALGSWQGTELHFPVDPPKPAEGVAILVQAADGQMIGAGVVQAQ